MAMPNGNFVISDKMQFPNGGGAVGGEIHHPRPWFPDERDGFISWLRAEFAAANAIIDTLCHHLRAVSDPGEYDLVIGCVHQRRSAWSPVLHMQQYFPISEIMLALQQVAWKRQQRLVEQNRVGGKEFKRSGGLNSFGSRQGQRAEATKEYHNLSVDSQTQNVNAFVPGNLEKKGAVKEKEKDGAEIGYDVRKLDDKGASDAPNVTDASLKSEVDSTLKNPRNTDGANHPCTESPSDDMKDEKRSNSEGSNNLLVGKNGDVIQNQSEKNLIVSPKVFSAMETIDGNMVNVAEGLNLYGKLFDEAEVSKLISLVNDLRATGRRGQLPGKFIYARPTFVASKRPYRGHGREMIQLDRRVEPIPAVLQGFINRIMNMQLAQSKPDSCVIDIFNEGDHSQPHSFPPRYGRPVCVLSLNDCDMVFGTAIAADRPGTYRGALRINFAPGSLLVMQGNSTDIAKRAIPSIRKERVLITFVKSQPRKAFQPESHHHHHSQVVAPQQPPNWGPPPQPNRQPPNHIRPKHYAPVPATGVLPAPPIRAQLPPPNAIPPLYAPPPVPAPMAFPASMPYPSAQRGPTPRIPVPGTGVFLPPPGGSTSPKKERAEKDDGNVGVESGEVVAKEDEQKSVDSKPVAENDVIELEKSA
ncbi:hypothetical protein V2J09_012690 [Rumex salicifolius]